MKNFDLKKIVRCNIWELKPYSSARDEFSGTEGLFLDANENPFGNHNRYPDPHQRKLKLGISEIKRVSSENIFIGNGSDEAIDLVFRIFCEPSKDSVIICPPTYGMYEVSANINNVNIIKVPLTDDFQLNIEQILAQKAKVVFICSPNNPTGNDIENIDIILDRFDGLVVVDEAYIDFSNKKSYISKLSKYPNLLVMQTFSKAWGLASARVGMAFASKEIIELMNKTKPPYNISKFNQEKAIEALSNKKQYETQICIILEQRNYLIEEFSKLDGIKKIYPTSANFVLIEVEDATNIYNQLVEKNIITRNRTTQIRNTIRISVGNPNENMELIDVLKKIL